MCEKCLEKIKQDATSCIEQFVDIKENPDELECAIVIIARKTDDGINMLTNVIGCTTGSVVATLGIATTNILKRLHAETKGGDPR